MPDQTTNTPPPASTQPPSNQTPPVAPPVPVTWDAILAALPEEHKALYEEHTGGLRRTVQATRQERDTLQAKLGEITTALGKDPAEAKRLLEETSEQLKVATQRAEFAEQASRPEIGCTNPANAFLIARAQGLFNSRGVPDWEKIKEVVPEFFKPKLPPAGNAGSGTGAPPPTGKSMNDFIRTSAKRG